MMNKKDILRKLLIHYVTACRYLKNQTDPQIVTNLEIYIILFNLKVFVKFSDGLDRNTYQPHYETS